MKEHLSLEERIKARVEERKKDPRYHVNVFKVDFAEAVARQLEKTKISRAELAKRLGSSRAYVTKMLNEVLLAGPNLTMESMAKLAFALGAKIEPQFVQLSHDFTESKFASTWSSPSDSKISERLSRCPSRPDKDYSSEPVLNVVFVPEQRFGERKREEKSEAVAIAS